MVTIKTKFSVSLLVLLLTGCGGGGGGGGGTAASDRVTAVGESDVRVPAVDGAVSVPPVVEVVNPAVVNPAPVPPVVPGLVAPPAGGIVPPAGVIVPPKRHETVVLRPADRKYQGKQIQADGSIMSITDFIGREGGLFTVAISGTDVSVTVREKFNTYPLSETAKKITSLKDTDGSLLGYYGFMSAYTTEPNRQTGSTADKIRYPQHSIFYAMNTGQGRLPAVAATYKGDFVFVVDGVKHTATALFLYSDKTLDGSIKHNVLGSGIVREWETKDKAAVEDDGTFHARLISKKTAISDGEMTGGFFGTKGQVLAAVAKSTDEATDKEKWQGIFVATQTPPASP